MVNERAASAITRIERALARAETLPVRAAGSDAGRALAELEGRHGALKQELRQTIEELDHLIAQAGAGAA